MTETNWYEFRAVDADFIETAPTRWVVEAGIAASRKQVWDAFVYPSTWQHWFPQVERVVYEGTKPYGVGTIRKSWVGGCAHEQTILIWDDGSRWAYRIDRASEPLATAQIELTEFADAPDGGTIVTWTLACEPLPGLTYFAGDKPFEPFLQQMLEEALRRLEAWLKR